LLGHTKLESTVRYLGIESNDALKMGEHGQMRLRWTVHRYFKANGARMLEAHEDFPVGIRANEGTGLRVLFVSNRGKKTLKQPPKSCPLLRSQPSRSAYLLNSPAPVGPAEH
jgi:hypothetical protein